MPRPRKATKQEEEELKELALIEQAEGSGVFKMILDSSSLDFAVWRIKQAPELLEEEKGIVENAYTQYLANEIGFNEMSGLIKTYFKLWEDRINQKRSKEKGKFKFSGHMIDSMLHYTKPGQLTIFEQLEDESLKRKVALAKQNNKFYLEGVKLSVVEDRVVNALYKLIHEQNLKKTLRYENDIPRLDIPLYTLYEACELQKIKKSKQDDYSGGDVETIKKALDSLSTRPYLIRYVRTEIDKKGNKKSTVVEQFQTLITLVKIYSGLTEEETDRHLNKNITTDRKGRIAINLNPILLDQLDTKYILLPKDINTRIALAAQGRQRLPDCIPLFIKYLLRQAGISKNRNEEYHHIGYETLVGIIGLEKELKDGRRKRIEERLAECFQIAKNMDLLLEHKERENMDGIRIFMLKLNYDY